MAGGLMTLNGTTKLPCANNDLVAAPARQLSRRPTGLLCNLRKGIKPTQRRSPARPATNGRRDFDREIREIRGKQPFSRFWPSVYSAYSAVHLFPEESSPPANNLKCRMAGHSHPKPSRSHIKATPKPCASQEHGRCALVFLFVLLLCSSCSSAWVSVSTLCRAPVAPLSQHLFLTARAGPLFKPIRILHFTFASRDRPRLNAARESAPLIGRLVSGSRCGHGHCPARGSGLG